MMDINEIIAKMFLKDYQVMWEGDKETRSQVQILSEFLMWIEQRKTGCKLVDLRLAKDPMAQAVVDELRW
jgi:hypothetical protein